ncbi:MAG TPA: chemotaxis protein CheW [Gammaproteobacteria bacterium]|nr:chemotaxis protein CheW [Gammaproteobacteria bacterium]
MNEGGSPKSPHDGAEAAGSLEGEWLTPSAALGRFVPAVGARPSSAVSAEAAVRYGFRVAGIGLLLGNATGAELVAQGRVSPIPNGPAWLKGLMNLRGNLVPIVDIATVLGIESAQAETALLLVFGKGDRAVGVPIAAAPEAIRGLSAVSQLPPLPERLLGHAGDGFLHGQDFWIEFQHESFFESLAAEGSGA